MTEMTINVKTELETRLPSGNSVVRAASYPDVPIEIGGVAATLEQFFDGQSHVTYEVMAGVRHVIGGTFDPSCDWKTVAAGITDAVVRFREAHDDK